MNQIFKDRYNQFLSGDIVKKSESAPTDQKNNPEVGNITFYEDYSGIRNICFILKNGSKVFLNYNYLVSAEYKPNESQLIIRFTTHHVTLVGINLEALFEELMSHSIRSIQTSDKRYNHLEHPAHTCVNEIEIIEL